jgi:hypothetical protein
MRKATKTLSRLMEEKKQMEVQDQQVVVDKKESVLNILIKRSFYSLSLKFFLIFTKRKQRMEMEASVITK